jgi:hypothetical protein
MKGLDANMAIWISKYTRGRWKVNESGKIDIEGDVIITDSRMENLPVSFGSVTGKIMFKGCHSLKSLEGFPEHAFQAEFEDCLLPAEFYIEAIKEKLTLEEYISKKMEFILENQETFQLVSSIFPDLVHEKRGLIASKKFGF